MTMEAHAKDASNKSMCSDLSVATYWFYCSLSIILNVLFMRNLLCNFGVRTIDYSIQNCTSDMSILQLQELCTES